MKKILLVLIAALASVTLKAQWTGDITVVNNTNCPIEYQIYVTDPNSPFYCKQHHNGTAIMSIAPMSTVTWSLTNPAAAPPWVAVPLPTPTDEWIAARVGYDQCGNSWTTVGAACVPMPAGGVILACNGCPPVRVIWDLPNKSLIFM